MADAGEDPASAACLRQDRTRGLQRGESLFPAAARLLSRGKPLSSARAGQRAVSRYSQPARALDRRPDGGRQGRQHSCTLHQLRPPRHDRLFLRHGGLQRHLLSRLRRRAGRQVLLAPRPFRDGPGQPALECQLDGAPDVGQHPGAGFPGVPARRGPQTAGLHGRIRRRHADLHARRGGGSAGSPSAGGDGLAYDARRLPVRKRTRLARGILEYGDRRRGCSAPSDSSRGERGLDERHADGRRPGH